MILKNVSRSPQGAVKAFLFSYVAETRKSCNFPYQMIFVHFTLAKFEQNGSA